MSFARWTDDLLTGHPLIDEQHQRWYSLVNALHDAIVAGQGPEVLGRALEAVQSYTSVHFDAEEAIMRVRGYPGYGPHKLLHGALSREVAALVRRQASGTVLPMTVGVFLGKWLRDHIESVDRQFIGWLKTTPV